MTSKKISGFTAQSTFQAGDQLNIVRSSTNFKIDISNLAAFLGVTGTIQPVGSGSAIPVLEQPSATSNNIRGVESGSGILASISAQNGITLKHNFTFDKTGAKLTADETIASPVFRSIKAGSGINITASGNVITVAQAAGGGTTVSVVTTNHSTSGNETVICNNTSPITVTLDASPTAGDEVNIKRWGSAAVTVSGNIDGQTSKILETQYDNITIQYIDATIEWAIL